PGLSAACWGTGVGEEAACAGGGDGRDGLPPLGAESSEHPIPKAIAMLRAHRTPHCKSATNSSLTRDRGGSISTLRSDDKAVDDAPRHSPQQGVPWNAPPA
ncbi:MAG: hypothetical protein V3T64_00255, partial [Myxococcota bacterium]